MTVGAVAAAVVMAQGRTAHPRAGTAGEAGLAPLAGSHFPPPASAAELAACATQAAAAAPPALPSTGEEARWRTALALSDTCRVERVSVVGNSGSGKTTLAAELARRLAAPHLELDSVFHQPGWQPLPAAEFRARVAEFVAGDRWVVDGNYSSVQDLVWQRADTVVWLDLPRHRVMRQIIGRTLRRALTRAELWNGNREEWSSIFRADPAKSVIAWAWTRHRVVRDRYSSAQADPANAHLTFIRLRSEADMAALTGRAGRD